MLPVTILEIFIILLTHASLESSAKKNAGAATTTNRVNWERACDTRPLKRPRTWRIFILCWFIHWNGRLGFMQMCVMSWLLCWFFSFYSNSEPWHGWGWPRLFYFSSRIRILFDGNNERTTASGCDLPHESQTSTLHASRRVSHGSWLFCFAPTEIW